MASNEREKEIYKVTIVGSFVMSEILHLYQM